MMRAEAAIARMRRDLTLSVLLKAVLVTAAMTAVAIDAVLHRTGATGSLLLAGIGVVWIVLSYRSMRGSQISAESPLLIAAGKYDEAEETIDAAIRSFSLFRGVKLRCVHQLAMLRHAQRRWSEAAMLCQALLSQRLGALENLARSARLMLAESLLEQNDLRGAHQAISGLYSQRLTLGEALELNLVQMEYLSRIGAWDHMLYGLQNKVELAELMPTTKAARMQALLALAARRSQKRQWEAWLRRRAELLMDADQLVAERPMLRELWANDGTNQ